MHPTITIAVRAARKAGQTIVRSFQQLDSLQVTEKSSNDYVSEVDRRAEQDIISIIRKAYPHHAILAEESGAQGEGDFKWVIDPLDGTTNFVRGIPQFAVSIAMMNKDKLEAAVVYDPWKDELFTAHRGSGATLNDRRIRVTTRPDLNGALLGTGVPFRADQDLDVYLQSLQAMLPDTAGMRRAGSAALDLAYVAAGRFDGFWEFGLNSWDMAAGILLVQEAGGLVSDLGGGKNYLESGNVVCGNPRVHKQMLERLQQSVPKQHLR